VSKLAIASVADFWQQAMAPHANMRHLLSDVDDMDMSGYQVIFRLLKEGRITLSDLNQQIVQTMKMMGYQGA
jgi:anti-anti-sigma regulatory factor